MQIFNKLFFYEGHNAVSLIFAVLCLFYLHINLKEKKSQDKWYFTRLCPVSSKAKIIIEKPRIVFNVFSYFRNNFLWARYNVYIDHKSAQMHSESSELASTSVSHSELKVLNAIKSFSFQGILNLGEQKKIYEMRRSIFMQQKPVVLMKMFFPDAWV